MDEDQVPDFDAFGAALVDEALLVGPVVSAGRPIEPAGTFLADDDLVRVRELRRIEEMGGAVKAVDTGYLKQQLVESNSKRIEAIERGERTVVGVNRFSESEESPLSSGEDAILTVPDYVETEQIVASITNFTDFRFAANGSVLVVTLHHRTLEEIGL